MAWVAASDANWIKVRQSVSKDFQQSRDFSDDSAAGTRYVAVFVQTTVLVEELRGLTRAAALAVKAADDEICTKASKTFSDTKSGSPYSCTVPACDGKTVALDAVRANEADGWTVTRTTTATAASAVWGDGSYSDTLATATGSTRSSSVRYYSQNVVARMVPGGYLTGTDGVRRVTSWKPYVVNLDTVETVEETTGLTEAAAKAQALAYGSGVTTVVGTADSYERASHSAEARYGGSKGWTVTKTSRTSSPNVISS